LNKNILRLAYVILTCLAFISLYIGFVPVYLSHVEAKSRRGEAAWLTDPRIFKERQKIVPGNIYDKNGTLLAQTVNEGEKEKKRRSYPLGKNFAHITGYSSAKYGVTGLEASMAPVLLGKQGYSTLIDFLARVIGKKTEGNSLILTVDASLQEKAYSLLAGRQGAVVAIKPKTGEVLALASSPSFDPNKIDSHMASLRKDPRSPLLNRATQGSYAPGSVFKLVTLAAALEENPGITASTFMCPGYLTVEGFKLTCNGAHGKIDLKKALALSCNTTFAALGIKIGAQSLVETAEAFGFNGKCKFLIDYYPGTIAGAGVMSKTELASTAIGQGSAVANPMQMALVTCGVANNGIVMHPRLVHKIVSPEGKTIQQTRPEKWLSPMAPETARVIRDYMAEVIRSGTGTRASIPGVAVAGKTGTAENAGKAHGWFVGFAPVSDPEVVVSVIVENGGSGGAVAAPIGREIMRQAIRG